MDMKDLRLRANTVLDIPPLTGTIHPFLSTEKSVLGTASREIKSIMAEKETKRIFSLGSINVICTFILLLWCNSTNSMALTAYTYMTIFDIFSLLTCLVTIWVQKQKPTPIFSFGYERFEVLAVFSSTILAMLGSLFIMKESVERMVQQPEIHTGRLLVGTGFAFMTHMIVTYSQNNKAFNHVISASSSSWLQEHVADMSEGLCHVVPGLSKLLLPRINPFALIAFAGALALAVVYILIDMNNYYAADTWAAVWIAIMISGTMFPISVYSGKILLQTTPSHIIGQLDKCLREASTLDGVLEFRFEHFWTLGFGTMAGSVHVRIRRDADEQMVLAHVANRLSNLISVLTVQVFKDEWTRPSAYQILGESPIGGTKFPSGSSPLKFPVGGATSPDKPKTFPGISSYQPMQSFSPALPGSFPSFPTVGASGSMATGLSGSFPTDSAFGTGPVLGRTSHNFIEPFSSANTSLPDVLPASGMGINTSSTIRMATVTSSTAGSVVGLPVNSTVRLGIPNNPNQKGFKPS